MNSLTSASVFRDFDTLKSIAWRLSVGENWLKKVCPTSFSF